MAKFTGFMCDVCKTAENGNDRPEHWLGLKLPSNGSPISETRDLCSDKCLLKFARERAGDGRVAPTKNKGQNPELVDFLKAQGVRGPSLGGVIGSHVRRRHEMVGAVGDCLVCEFLTMKEDGNE